MNKKWNIPAIIAALAITLSGCANVLTPSSTATVKETWSLSCVCTSGSNYTITGQVKLYSDNTISGYWNDNNGTSYSQFQGTYKESGGNINVYNIVMAHNATMSPKDAACICTAVFPRGNGISTGNWTAQISSWKVNDSGTLTATLQ